jgi:hypothetical protein
MYHITDEQIDFILNDIRRNGVEIEDLQLNLLDHLCCIIENELEENGDFEQFYFQTIKKFYKKELREIEEETQSLLTYKNYYVMKKVMIISGAISAGLLSLGIFFKFMHWPGAAMGIVLGISILSFIFLPLMFVLKSKEKKEVRDKILIALGTLSAITISLAILFKVMHWPGANMMAVSALLMMLLLFLPIYFFNGIRNPETKLNTIVSSVLILAGCGLFLTLVRTPTGSRKMFVELTRDYIANEELLQYEKGFQLPVNNSSKFSQNYNDGKRIDLLCEELKRFIIKTETGVEKLDMDFESKETWLGDSRILTYIEEDQTASTQWSDLKTAIKDYNKLNASTSIGGEKPLQITSLILNFKDCKTTEALNSLIQIQHFVLQNERIIASLK